MNATNRDSGDHPAGMPCAAPETGIEPGGQSRLSSDGSGKRVIVTRASAARASVSWKDNASSTVSTFILSL